MIRLTAPGIPHSVVEGVVAALRGMGVAAELDDESPSVALRMDRPTGGPPCVILDTRAETRPGCDISCAPTLSETELAMRVSACHRGGEGSDNVVFLADCVVDLHFDRALWATHTHPLTTKERDVFVALRSRPHETVSRADLLTQVWDLSPNTNTRAVDNLVARLRKKIQAENCPQPPLRTVYGQGYRFTPPIAGRAPTAPKPERRTNIGPGKGAFVGRQALLSELVARSRPGMWITLTGPPGVGKTRLARELANACRERFDEVWFVDLTNAAPEAAVSRVAGVAGRIVSPGAPVQSLTSALAAGGEVLLVLDGCEGLGATAADFATQVLATAPLTLVATSSVPLDGRDEIIVEVPPLSPDAARALYRGLVGAPESPGDEAVLAELDGLPLAIELCAGWSRFSRPDQVAARVRSGLLLDAQGRTLRRALDTTWELLPPGHQHTLATLSVFTGPFAFSWAEGVCGDATGDLMARVDSLVRAGLLRTRAPHKLTMLGLVRRYAADKAREMGLWDEAVLRHTEVFMDLFDLRAAAPIYDPDVVLEATDELRAVFDRSLPERPRDALDVTMPLHWAYANRSQHIEFVQCSERLKTVCGQLSPRHQVRFTLRRVDALAKCARLEEARSELTVARQISDQHELEDAFVDITEGNILFVLGEYARAVQAFEAALRRAGGPGESWAMLFAHSGCGNALGTLGRIEEARGHYELAIEYSQRLGYEATEGVWTGNLAMLLDHAGRPEEALHGYRRAEAQLAGNIGDLDNLHAHMAEGLLKRGDTEQAVVLLSEVVTRLRSHGRLSLALFASGRLALGLALSGNATQAPTVVEEAIRRARLCRVATNMPGALMDLATVHAIAGRWQEAVQLGSESIELARQQDSGFMGRLLCLQSINLAGAGDHGQAERMLVDATHLEIREPALESMKALAVAAMNLAANARAGGSDPAAVEDARQALAAVATSPGRNLDFPDGEPPAKMRFFPTFLASTLLARMIGIEAPAQMR